MKKIMLTIAFALLGFMTVNAQSDSIQTKQNSQHELVGKASYYGSEYKTPRKTANGETFNKEEHTAAHKTLPFGTIVKVTNLKNNTSVTVRINDRGPFIKGRVIDVTTGAARKLGMINSGVAPVELEIISMPEPKSRKTS